MRKWFLRPGTFQPVFPLFFFLCRAFLYFSPLPRSLFPPTSTFPRRLFYWFRPAAGELLLHLMTLLAGASFCSCLCHFSMHFHLLCKLTFPLLIFHFPALFSWTFRLDFFFFSFAQLTAERRWKKKYLPKHRVSVCLCRCKFFFCSN